MNTESNQEPGVETPEAADKHHFGSMSPTCLFLTVTLVIALPIIGYLWGQHNAQQQSEPGPYSLLEPAPQDSDDEEDADTTDLSTTTDSSAGTETTRLFEQVQYSQDTLFRTIELTTIDNTPLQVLSMLEVNRVGAESAVTTAWLLDERGNVLESVSVNDYMSLPSLYETTATNSYLVFTGSAGGPVFEALYRINLSDYSVTKVPHNNEYWEPYQIDRLIATDEGWEQESGGSCVVQGCSGTICVDEAEFQESPFATTCEYLPHYACYENAVCERQIDGECGWTKTVSFSFCLNNWAASNQTD